MKLSFIIPAWNEEALISATIASLHSSASAFEYEIIVANDASDDRTAEIADAQGATVVNCDNRQIGPTRNDGANVASGDVFIFVDADTIVQKEVVHETVKAIERGAVAGGSFPRFDGKIPFIAKCLSNVLEFGFKLKGVSAGAYIFCTRKAFLKSGGFDPKFYAAEEVHFSYSLHTYGPFKTIDSHVVTSGRKFRTHSLFEIFPTLFLVSIPGIRNIKKRKKLWYGERRNEST